MSFPICAKAHLHLRVFINGIIKGITKDHGHYHGVGLLHLERVGEKVDRFLRLLCPPEPGGSWLQLPVTGLSVPLKGNSPIEKAKVWGIWTGRG